MTTFTSWKYTAPPNLAVEREQTVSRNKTGNVQDTSGNPSKVQWLMRVLLFVYVLLVCPLLHFCTAGLTLREFSKGLQIYLDLDGRKSGGHELHKLYSSRAAVKEKKRSGMRCTGCAARVVEMEISVATLIWAISGGSWLSLPFV